MKPYRSVGWRLVSGALLPFVAVALSAPPASAGADDAAPVRRTPSGGKTPLVTAALARAEAGALSAQASAESPAAPAVTDDPSFFKSRKGAAVLALFAIGVGYTLYSKSNDRIKSPVRE